jgi:hypothetical protein
MMTGERTTRSSKETYMAFTFSRAALAFGAARSRTFNAMPSSSIFVTQHSSLRLPETNYGERNHSIDRASESVRQKERGY